MWVHRPANQFRDVDIVGWTDAGITKEGEVGLGWILLERSDTRRVVAMGYIYQSADEAVDGYDSSREELKALMWAMNHLWHIRQGRPLANQNPMPHRERQCMRTKILKCLCGAENGSW